MEAERRQHRRHSVRDDGFEIFSRDSKIIGKLSNISQGGLAFYYTPVGRQIAASETIDIMAKSPDPFFLPSAACRTVYDISVLTEDQSFTGAATRLCGVKFVRLQKEQTQKLGSISRNTASSRLKTPDRDEPPTKSSEHFLCLLSIHPNPSARKGGDTPTGERHRKR